MPTLSISCQDPPKRCTIPTEAEAAWHTFDPALPLAARPDVLANCSQLRQCDPSLFRLGYAYRLAF
eukprot:2871274-Amphidinium_carterae.1